MKTDARVICLIALAHGMSHFYQLLLAPLFPFVKDELGVSYAALGFLVAVFYTISGVVQPLAGFVVDRYGARAVLLGGVGIFIAGMAAMTNMAVTSASVIGFPAGSFTITSKVLSPVLGGLGLLVSMMSSVGFFVAADCCDAAAI